MKEYLTQKNLIISSIIIVLLVVGVAFKKRQALAPVITDDVNNSVSDVVIPKDSVDSTTITPKGEPKILTYDQYLQEGIDFEKKGKLNDALISYKNASNLAPTEYVPFSNAGSAYYAMKKYTEAEDHFLEAIRLSPNNVSVYTKLYDVYFYGLKRDRSQMNTFFTDAMLDTKNDISIVKLYAFYLENVEDFKASLSIWESLLKFEPENATYKAKVYTLQKKVVEL